jgi:hypothetical protein
MAADPQLVEVTRSFSWALVKNFIIYVVPVITCFLCLRKIIIKIS